MISVKKYRSSVDTPALQLSREFWRTLWQSWHIWRCRKRFLINTASDSDALQKTTWTSMPIVHIQWTGRSQKGKEETMDIQWREEAQERSVWKSEPEQQGLLIGEVTRPVTVWCCWVPLRGGQIVEENAMSPGSQPSPVANPSGQEEPIALLFSLQRKQRNHGGDGAKSYERVAGKKRVKWPRVSEKHWSTEHKDCKASVISTWILWGKT